MVNTSQFDAEGHLRIARAVEGLDEAWGRGEPIALEDVLREVDDAERTELLREALHVELEHRRARGETPTVEEYERRFPGDLVLIQSVFAEPTTVPVPGPLPEPTDRDAMETVAKAEPEETLLREDPVGPTSAAIDVETRVPVDVPTLASGIDTNGPHGKGLRSGLGDQPHGGGLFGYDLLAELGRGGMGVVFKARQRGLNRLVALKVIREGRHAHPEHLARFRIEAEAVARLRHPNILQIYEIGEWDEGPFVALELLEGGSLADRINGTPQPARSAAELLVTLARAVDAAHRAGIIHRDLKPSNVLFDSDGQPKVADFGLAKRMEVEQGDTQTGQVMGTPSYMAPEQALGQLDRIGPATDVYALGAILYELLTGRPPFKAPSALETIAQVTHDEPVPPSRLQSRVPRDLETICLKCLAKEPPKRYAAAQELADDLARYLNGEPIRARRTPVWERGVKWARRRPTTATLLALGLLTTLVLIGIGIRSRADRRAQEQRRAEQVASWRKASDETIFKGQGLLARKRWTEARELLTNRRTEIRNEDLLADLRARADTLIAQANQGLAEQEEEDQDHQRYEQFLQHRKQALFYETQFTGLDLPGSEEATRQSAHAALGLFAAPGRGDAWTLGTLPASLTADERTEITAGCYELLLILAGAADRPERGLTILDRAAALHPPTRAYHLRRAACLERAGDLAGARREREEAGRLEPSSALDHFLIGQERYKRDDWRGALPHFEAALRVQPDHFWAHALSAVCCLQLNRPAEARSELISCFQREREFAWLYVLRGFALSQAAVRPGAEADATRLFHAAEDDFRQGESLLKQSADEELRYVLLVNRGLMWFQRRELDRAGDDLRAAIRLNDRHFQAFAALAKVEQERGQPEDAFAQYTEAIRLRPAWAPLYRSRADVFLNRADLDETRHRQILDDLDQAIQREKSGSPVLARDQTNRAKLLLRDGREPEALAACEAALKIEPAYQEAHLLRLQALLRLKRYDDLLASCQALVDRGKASFDVFALRALARTSLKDYVGAIEDDTQALALRPDSAPVLTRRGWLYLIEQSPKLALRDFERSIAHDPKNGDAHNGRGTARLRLGDLRGAVADAEEALRLGEPTARLSYDAARIYAQASLATSADPRRKPRHSAPLANRYRARALSLLAESRSRLPADRRDEFWRTQVQSDPDLRPILSRVNFTTTPAPPSSQPDRQTTPDQ
jgi:serine/threonine protein kinase/lipoprotein NlpI